MSPAEFAARVPFALDIVGAALALGAATCAARSLRWLERHAVAPGAAPRGAAPDRPEVSLLVPARDEARNAGPCLAGLLAQAGVSVEVLLLDDGSRDDTAGIASRAFAADPRGRGRLLRGAELPPGWAGKPFACHQLAAAATGEWLLFVDADTRLAPDGAARALAAAASVDAGLVSFLPRYVGAHWSNRLVVPWLYYFLTALVPLPDVLRRRSPRLAVANGQAVLVRRSAYDRLGGHAAVRDHVIEDVSLAIAAKTAGVRIALLDGRRWLTCAMYGDARGFVRGFAKSFHSAARRYPGQWLGMTVLLALVGVRPWLRLASGVPGGLPILPWASVLLVGATYAVLLRRFGQSLAALAAWPASLALLVAISIGGGLAGWAGRPIDWRGRSVGGAGAS